MKRLLFVFAKLNPGLTYVQGMNEVLAPLYYTYSLGGLGGVALLAWEVAEAPSVGKRGPT